MKRQLRISSYVWKYRMLMLRGLIHNILIVFIFQMELCAEEPMMSKSKYYYWLFLILNSIDFFIFHITSVQISDTVAIFGSQIEIEEQV